MAFLIKANVATVPNSRFAVALSARRWPLRSWLLRWGRGDLTHGEAGVGSGDPPGVDIAASQARGRGPWPTSPNIQ
jgi:hypothetical protein